jgi:glucosamine 6-phosphate synthetase-like amidotransferase/phosphosugar isomerase protein
MIELDFDKMGGLVPAIAQDYQTGEVLMVAFMNKEAWELTVKTGIVHYWSRSRNELWKKGETSGNIQEVKARGGKVVSVVSETGGDAERLSDFTIRVPQANELLLPILEVVPLQLLAYHVAVRRGCDVDQPRNLAKSVTVE